ncbi:hypothetical protein SUGI_0005860 [Cryptomeria japonica]|uniref:uncharacterized protein LOC131027387 n=1 Tax=Cryptomeria japonica TaxID=3369 RepID=UPI0024089873|nr:uncharacterized protein LOC131027387 [Cryptomeria japonica]GLJ04890.1 hypothetical protein SUGI_0005860 [Cryptomeria japonica]
MKSEDPWDPHEPDFNSCLVRPYPWFEGWFFRIRDPQSDFSIALIIATNYVTSESHATLLFCNPGENPNSDGSIENGITHMVYELTKDATITKVSNSLEDYGFDWEEPTIGKVLARKNKTNIDVHVKGYHLKANLTSKVHWNLSDPYKGPEGWASIISILPTRWYIDSLGSKASYEFKDTNGLDIIGQGWAHEEKNWGQIFPDGHVWLQASSNDNSTQLVCSVAWFKVGSVKMPYIFSLGFRSPSHQIDMRTIDIGTLLTDVSIRPHKGEFSMRAINPSYSIQITAVAPPESFSEPILAPVSKLEWKPTCRESYFANIKVEVYDHVVWGIPIDKKLVSSHTFSHAALEFGGRQF